MKKYYIEVQRESEEPAVFHIEREDKPTYEDVEILFKEEGYEDDWGYIGRVIIEEVFNN